jgi:hypothetical protein
MITSVATSVTPHFSGIGFLFHWRQQVAPKRQRSVNTALHPRRQESVLSPDEPKGTLGTRVHLAWLTVTLKMEAVSFSETSLKFAG